MPDRHDIHDDITPEERRRARDSVEVVVWFRRVALVTLVLIAVGLVLTLGDQGHFFKSASQRHDVEEEQKLRAILPEGVLEAPRGEDGKIPLYEDPQGPSAGQVRKRYEPGTEVIILSSRVADGENWNFVQVIGERGQRGWIPQKFVVEVENHPQKARQRIE